MTADWPQKERSCTMPEITPSHRISKGGRFPWRTLLTLGFGLSLLSACGGGGGGNGSGSTANATSSTTTTTITSSTSSTTTASISISGDGNTVIEPGVTITSVGTNSTIAFTTQGNQTLSNVFTFNSASLAALGIPKNTARTNSGPALSFLLHLVGTGVGDNGVTFQSVTNPQGKALDLSIQPCVPNYCGVLVPRIPAMIGVDGSWSFRLQSAASTVGDFKLYVTLRAGQTPDTNTKIVVAPYMLKASRYSATSIKAALDHLVAIYSKNQLTVQVRDITVVDDSRYLVTNLDFSDPTTQSLIAKGTTDAVNIFFVDDFTDFGALGIASAIPGSMGLAGGFNGILIGLAPHRINRILDTNFLGETAAHEMGHFLGLFHTSESDGVTFDPIADTPECPIGRDINRSGSVEADECAGLAADNLMFWTPYTTTGTRVTQDGLTNDQRTVIRYAPIGQ
ncbi:MAG: hypothetical protein HQL73_13625 [Magnetococcales bacterium]|nr:hypothetical protein [Magnetococcales bacterium]